MKKKKNCVYKSLFKVDTLKPQLTGWFIISQKGTQSTNRCEATIKQSNDINSWR